MVKPEIVNDERMIPLARDICKKSKKSLNIPDRLRLILSVKAERPILQNCKIKYLDFNYG